MSEYEKFSLAENQEHPAFTPPEAAPRNEAREAKLNPRVQALMTARDEAERKLQEAILDVETREGSSSYEKAKELYESGMRLKVVSDADGFDNLVYGPQEAVRFYAPYDHRYEKYSYRNNGEIESDSPKFPTTSMRESKLLQEAGLADRDDAEQVLMHLRNLTTEERS